MNYFCKKIWGLFSECLIPPTLTTLQNNSRTNRGTSEGPETSAQEYLTRRIKISRVYFSSVYLPILGVLALKLWQILHFKYLRPRRPHCVPSLWSPYEPESDFFSNCLHGHNRDHVKPTAALLVHRHSPPDSTSNTDTMARSQRLIWPP